MSTRKQTGEAETKPATKEAAKKSKRTGAGARKPSRAGLVDEMIDKFNEKFQGDGVNVSVTDFIRLVQLREGLRDEEPTEVIVTWVEPSETESASET